jgi:hypothetical protein
MKYVMILIICMQALVLLNGVSGEFSSGSIVIESPNSLNPKFKMVSLLLETQPLIPLTLH